MATPVYDTPLYSRIEEANAAAARSELKGGVSYIAVHERVKAFRKIFPAGTIETTVQDAAGVCTCTARVYIPGFYLFQDLPDPLAPVLIATGTAREKDGSTFVNKTSYIENCETSAVGRALGFCGFGIDTAIASAEEVQNAELNDTARQKITPEMLAALKTRCREDGVPAEKIQRLYKVKALEDLSIYAFSNLNTHWEKIKA